MTFFQNLTITEKYGAKLCALCQKFWKSVYRDFEVTLSGFTAQKSFRIDWKWPYNSFWDLKTTLNAWKHLISSKMAKIMKKTIFETSRREETDEYGGVSLLQNPTMAYISKAVFLRLKRFFQIFCLKFFCELIRCPNIFGFFLRFSKITNYERLSAKSWKIFITLWTSSIFFFRGGGGGIVSPKPKRKKHRWKVFRNGADERK